MLYNIYRKTKAGRYEVLTTIVGDTSEFVVERLKIGDYYQFSIKAYYADGSISPWSEEIEVKF